MDVPGAVESPQRPHLAEEGVELPELILLSLVEGVVVTLCALDLHAEENLSRLRRGLNTVFLHLSAQEIGGPVEAVHVLAVGVGPRGGDKFLHEAVVWDVLRKRTPQILSHARPTHHLVLNITTDQHGGPNVSPVPGIVVDEVVAQQTVHEIGPLRGRRVGDKRLQFSQRRDAADDVEVHPAAPLSIRCRFRRLEPCVGPASGDLLVDELHLRDAKVLAIRGAGSLGTGREQHAETHRWPGKSAAWRTMREYFGRPHHIGAL